MEGNGGRAQVKGLDYGMPGTPVDGDAGDHAQRRYLRVYIAICFAVLALAAGFLVVGASWLLFVFPLFGIALGVAVGELLWFIIGRSAASFGRLILSAGDLPYAPTYSAEESLVARGEYAAAAKAYRAHADADATDLTPLIRLAELSRRHLHDNGEAERIYLEIRRRSGDPGAMANQLIDLYRATGSRGRLMAELSRFAAAHPETAAGAAARKELQSMKAADSTT